MEQQAAIEKMVAKLRSALAFKHMAIATEKSYVHWAKRYAWWLFKHREGTSEQKVRAYLTQLAEQCQVSASTQTQALNAIVFLYREVFHQPLGDIGAFSRSTKPKRLPVVLSRDEVHRIRGHLHGVHWLFVSLLYGTGMRCAECLSLRVQDVDFDRKQIFVRNGKGGKDRTVQLPAPLIAALKEQIETSRRNHRRDLAAGLGDVYLPHALERKYGASIKEFKWQYIFQASKVGPCPRTGVLRRHHLHASAVSKAIRSATKLAGVHKKVGAHTFRHSYATHLRENGVSRETVQELLGHADIRTTQIYDHVMQNAASSVPSPLEAVA